MRNRKSNWLVVKVMLLVSVFVLLSSCATHMTESSGEPPGFLLGLFHGVTIFFTLVGSFFTDYRIYAFPNSGLWYDVGFVMGASLFLGGGAASGAASSS